MALVGSAYVNWMDSDLCRSGMTGYNPHVQQEGRNRHRTFSFKAIDKALADRGRRCHVARPDAQFMDVSTCSATRHPTAPSLGLLRIGTRRRKQVQAAKGFRTDRQHSWHRTIESQRWVMICRSGSGMTTAALPQELTNLVGHANGKFVPIAAVTAIRACQPVA